MSIALDRSHVQGLLDLPPQVAEQIFHDNDDHKIDRPGEEVANDVGVMKKSQPLTCEAGTSTCSVGS